MRGSADRSIRSLVLGAARATLLAVATAWALWIVAAQVFLWTPLLRNVINANSPSIHVEYASAWSLWPGTVHLRRLVLVGQDRNVQWRLALDEVKTSIAIGQLAERAFHATSVRVHGVQFALRRRAFLYGKVPREAVAGLPLIEGLPPVPLKAEGPDDVLPDWRYHLFTVWLENVQGSGLRQIWIDRWRMDGPGEVSGAFYLKPVRDVLIAPAMLLVRGVEVSERGKPVLAGVEGTLRVSLGRFDPRGLTRQRLFGTFDADVDLRGRLRGIEAFGGRGGAGPVEAMVRVRGGRVEQGSARATLDEVSIWRLEAETAGFIASAKDRWEARLDLGEPRLRSAAMRAQSVQVRAAGDPVDLASLRDPRSATVDVLGGRIDDFARLASRVLHTSRVRSGSGAFTAHLRGPWKRLHGRARISLANVRVSARGVLVQGNARIDARIASFNPRRSADLSGTRFSIDDGRLVPDMEVSPGWWARGVLPRAHIAFVDPRLDANVRAQCRDARPIVGIYSHLEDLPGFVKGMFTMDGLTLRGSAHAGRGWLVVPDVKAQGESASVEATLLREGDVQRGAALLTVHGISVALDLRDGGSDLHIFGPGGFFADRQREVLAQPMGRRTPPLRH